MARNSTDIASAIQQVNGIVAAQNAALQSVKTALEGKAAGGGTDLSLGVTGASVGDIVKVKAVDENGKPTEWEAADGEEKWEVLMKSTLTEAVSSVGVAFVDAMCKKVIGIIETPAVEANTNYSYFEFYTNQPTPGGTTKSSFSPYAIPRTEKTREVFFGELVKVGDMVYAKGFALWGNEFNCPWDGTTDTASTHNTGTAAMFKRPLDNYQTPLGDKIQAVYFRTYATFPVGTNVTFLGVRA